MIRKQIPGYSEFSITSAGEIRNKRGLKLSSFDCNGYRRISLRNDEGKRHGVDVHRLVVSTYLGPIPKGMWVNHKNGDKADNRVENLEIGTPAENHRHARDVLKRRYTGGGPKKLSTQAVDMIRLLGAANKWSQREIARVFQVSQPTVAQILSGKAWSPALVPPEPFSLPTLEK